MEVFFNELSVRPAESDAEARRWVETLADAVQVLQNVVESFSDNQLTFRRSEEFGLLRITSTQTLYEFLADQFDFLDKEYVLLISVFDSPYISEDDPQRNEFEYTSLTFEDTDYSTTGLAAAYLKKSLAVSFDSDTKWDTCQLSIQINRLDATIQEVSTPETVQHACRKQHLIDCHLELLAELFDWAGYVPRFDAGTGEQNVLPLLELFSLHVDEDWPAFYQTLSHLEPGQRVVRIETIARQIATIQRWQPATGSLHSQNRNRTIYIIPNSNLIAAVDTQHGEFEIHTNQGGNNHLGAISFDGIRFKPKVSDRRLSV